MLQETFPTLEQQPLLWIVPPVAIFPLMLSFNCVGDALRHLSEPQWREGFTEDG